MLFTCRDKIGGWRNRRWTPVAAAGAYVQQMSKLMHDTK